MRIDPSELEALIRRCLREDVGLGDVTTLSTVSDDDWLQARLLAKEPLVLAGLDVAEAVFRAVDPRVRLDRVDDGPRDGDEVGAGATVAQVSGPAAGVLTGERLALNLLQRMSGVATLTRAFVRALDGTDARVADTRKTAPGLRMLDKAAVRIGGGANHRWALDSGVLIKDNHLLVAGGVMAAVAEARRRAPHSLRVQVECKHLHQVDEALACGVDAVLLDNMAADVLAEAVSRCRGRVFVEVSGGITLDTARAKALDGVDLISTGQLTHSVRAVDISLDVIVSRGRAAGVPIERWEALPSTQARAKSLVDEGAAAPLVVVAERQSAGRGRRGRSWWAPHGGHLSASLALRPALPPAVAPRLSLVIGVAVAEAVAEVAPPLRERLELKWPNDVLLDGRKVAGVLCELSTRGAALDSVVVGIGVNVSGGGAAWPEALCARAIAIDEALGAPVSREALLRAILGRVMSAVADAEASAGALNTGALSRWVRPGRRVRVQEGEGAPFDARVRAVLADGALEVERVGGEVYAIIAGDVTPMEWRA